VERLHLRDDLAANTNRFTDSISKLVPRRLNDLSKHLIGKPAVVPQRLGNLSQVIIESDRVRLAIIPGLNRSQNLFVFLDELS
jgi:hypothetical protein